MVASGVGQYSINVKSNLRDFYGELSRSKRTMDELVAKKYQLEIDSKQLNELRDKAQRINGEMRELRQQKTEIKLGIREVEDAEAELKNIDKSLASLNRQKLAVEADIQPIRTANAELYKVDQEIDRLNAKKINIDISESMKSVGNSVNRMGDGILKAFNPLTSKINQMIGFGLINNLIGKGLNMVTGSVDGAISRVDTLNNFPKTMSNMNIAVEESEKAIQDLSDGLTGLPTRVDAAANSVQQFTNKNKDIQKSTDMFLSINNAILAGGADMQKQQSALDQLTNSYSIGAIDLNTWRALQQAMPAQLSQVSQAFQKTDDELYKALQSGNISMDEFMDKIIELNTTGVDGMQSFEQQAKNSVGGLKTSMANMNSAVTRGVAKIITTVDEIGKSKGLNGISGIFGKIGSFFENGLKSIAESIEKNQDAIFGFFESVVSFLVSIDYASFFEGLVEGLKEMGSMAKGIFNFVKPLFSLLGNGDVTKGLGKLIPKMLMLGFALKGIGLATKGLGSVFGVLGKFKNFKLPSFGFGKWAKGGSTLPLQSIGVEQFKDLGLKLTMIAGLSANVYLAAKAIQEVTKIENMERIYEKLAVIALAVSGMGLISIAVDKVSKMAGTSMITGLIAITAISAEIYVMSLSLEKLASIDINFIDIQKKMGSIALVIGEMTLVTVAVGAFMATGFGAVALGAGFVAITALALEIMLLAETIKQLDEKVPNDFGNVKNKIETIISVLDSIVDSNLSSFGALFDSIVSGFTTGSIIKTLDNLVVISDKLNELNKNTEHLDFNKAKKNINNLVATMELLKTNGGIFSSIGKWFKGRIDTAIFDNTKNLLNKAVEMADDFVALNIKLKDMEKLNFNKEAVSIAINAINEVVNEMISENGLFQTLKNFIKMDADNGILEKSQKTISLLDVLNQDLKKIEKLNFSKEAVLITIKAIKETVDEMVIGGGLFQSLFKLVKADVDNTILEKSGKTLSLIAGLNEELKSIEILKFNKKAVLVAISSIKDVVKELSLEGGLFDSLKNLWKKGIDNRILDKSFESIDKLANINNSLKLLETMKFNKEATLITVGAIRDVVNSMVIGDGLFASLALFVQKGIDNGTLEKSKQTLDHLDELNNAIKSIEILKFNKEAVFVTIGAIKDVIKETIVGEGLFDSLIKFVQNGLDNGILERSMSTIENLSKLNDSIKELEILKFNKDAVEITIKAINEVIEFAAGDKGLFSSLAKFVNNFFDSSSLDDALVSINKIAQLNETIKKIELLLFNKDNVFITIKAVEEVIERLNTFDTNFTNVKDFTPMVDSFSNLIAKIKELEPEFTITGRSYANSLVGGFREVDFPAKVMTIIENLLTKLKNKTDSFKSIGTSWGNALKNSFNSSVKGLGNGIDNQINSMSNKTNAFSSLGNTYGQSLNDGFNNALVMLDNSVNDRVSNLQRSISNVQTLSNSSSGTNSRRPNPVVLASGGKVSSPTGFARIVDSYEQPILGNGEGVIPKKIMDKIGMPFFDQLRRGQVSPTFANLGKSISNTTSSVINNVYNNTTTTNQQMTMYTTAAPDAINIMNRRLR